MHCLLKTRKHLDSRREGVKRPRRHEFGIGPVLRCPPGLLASPGAVHVELAQRLLASQSSEQGLITLLHIVDPRLNRSERIRIEHELRRWQPRSSMGAVIRIQLASGPGVETKIERSSRDHDLVILRSQRRQVAGLPIPASDRTSNLVSLLNCASMVISEPLT